MPMKNPPHPGHSIKDACLEPLHLSVTDAAKILGVARHTLSRVINGQAIYRRKWQFVWKRPDGPMPIIGCACKPLSILRRRGSMKARSRSNAMIPKNFPCDEQSCEPTSVQNCNFNCTHMLRMPLSVKSRFRKWDGKPACGPGEPTTSLSGIE